MKKWFEYQLEHQVQDFNWSSYSEPVTNLNKYLSTVFFRIKENHARGKYRVKLKNHFKDPLYQENAVDGVTLTATQLEEYINDPEYVDLVNGNIVTQIILNNSLVEYKALSKFIANKFEFDEDHLKLIVHLQQPGQYFALHIDKPKKKEFNDTDINSEYKRYLIFFDDWQMGQFFQMGTEFIKWKAGDAYTWNDRDVPHASANMGYEPRYMLMVTGKIKKGSQ